MPVRNGGLWIEAAIGSLLEQDYTDFLLVVSDNGSTDDTEAVVRRLAAEDSRIRYVRQASDHGGAWNHNEVFRLRHPGSEYFKWAAADDRHRPGYLAATVKLLDERPEAVLAHCRTVDVLGDGPEHLAEESPAGDDPDTVRRFGAYVRQRHAAFQGFGLVRASAMARTALLAPFTDSDLSLLAELSLHGRLVDVDEVLFERRVHAGQSTATHRTRRERMAWFDPGAADRTWLLPTALMGRELLRAIDRAPLSPPERWGCRRQLLHWAADSAVRFGHDVSSSLAAALLGRASGQR
jgi:glycosyltransferase involved in cell wall biosynthesis